MAQEKKIHLICPETAPTILASTNIAPRHVLGLGRPYLSSAFRPRCCALLSCRVMSRAKRTCFCTWPSWSTGPWSKYVEKSSTKISQTGTQISKTCREYENYFTSCDPHHDIYTFSYWQIFWHSI